MTEEADIDRGHGGTSKDVILGGQVTLIQPLRPAHRAGSDAVFLAATLSCASGRVLDMGAGCGAVGLIAAHRNPEIVVELAENDPLQLHGCRSSVAANADLADRISVLDVDVLATEPERVASGLSRERYDAILSNPPYRLAGSVRTTDARQQAHEIDEHQLDRWLRSAVSMLKPGGHLHLIFSAEGLALLLQSLDGRFGDVRIVGLHPRADAPAERLLLRGTKGRKAGPSLLPGLILHEDDGAYTKAVDAVLQGRLGINLSAD